MRLYSITGTYIFIERIAFGFDIISCMHIIAISCLRANWFFVVSLVSCHAQSTERRSKSDGH